ncbi:SUMO ligase siz1 [Trapelia coarctata]|nr:SUMO ligase siz1 [Trapelia coarctata]
MASTGTIDPQSIQVLIAKAKTLINERLKAILRAESLPVSGAKATMQGRIIDRINNHARTGDVAGFNRMRDLITNANQSSLSPHNHSSPATPPQNNMTMGSSRTSNPYPPSMTSTTYPHGNVRPQFKESPFYTIMEPLTPVLECKVDLQSSVREATRDQLDCKINLRADTVERLSRDPSLKAMVYSASEPISPFNKVDITFPHQIEIRVNLDEVKSNLRGLKNKPGSTRPADITHLLRKRAGYENNMTVIYALTNKMFHIVVNLVKQHPAESLVSKLESGKFISKQQVIREMVIRNQDPDIVATSSILSNVCTHNQCFDALSFLQLQEQAPTWTCPICNKVVSFGGLLVDQYVDDILRSTPRSVEQVTIEPDGSWSQVLQNETSGRKGTNPSDDEDDDLVEIQNMPRLTAIKDEAFPTPTSMARTPPYSSREQSSSSAAPRSNAGKRPISQIIDLTFSSDEEDQGHRPPKRQATQGISTGLSSSYASSGTPMGNQLPSLSAHPFTLPRLTPSRPPDPLRYGLGHSQS